MRIVVTGSAGFIGFHLVRSLLSKGHEVCGVDSFSDYYDVNLKKDRMKLVESDPSFVNHNLDICNYDSLNEIIKNFQPHIVIHLAAQAGVRYSINNPKSYIDSNINGFYNIIEICKNQDVNKFIYASSSSVYGDESSLPFTEEAKADKPLNLYAASKRSNELMAHSYNYLYGLDAVGLRFFTVYGPWGRPDMALYDFVKKILLSEEIEIFNNGDHSRDFTYIDDIISGILLVALDKNDKKDIKTSRIYNIGKGSPENLMDFLTTIENNLGIKADVVFKEKQMGDVNTTFADISKIKKDFGYNALTSIDEGVKNFVEWYIDYHNK